MSTTSNRIVTVSNSGDFPLPAVPIAAASNASAPGEVQTVALTSGNNAITVPATATACSIQKPAGNTVTLTLKGVNGDTGIALNLTDPDSISLASSVTTFVINAGGSVTVRLYWT